MAKYTRGPWRVRKGFTEGKEVYPVQKVAAGFAPAEICEISELRSEWRANADLIAASPRLHVASQLAFDLLGKLILSGMPVTKEVADARNALAGALDLADGGAGVVGSKVFTRLDKAAKAEGGDR